MPAESQWTTHRPLSRFTRTAMDGVGESLGGLVIGLFLLIIGGAFGWRYGGPVGAAAASVGVIPAIAALIAFASLFTYRHEPPLSFATVVFRYPPFRVTDLVTRAHAPAEETGDYHRFAASVDGAVSRLREFKLEDGCLHVRVLDEQPFAKFERLRAEAARRETAARRSAGA